MITFQELQEGVYDPNIFKCVFLAGGPGSGKSFVVRTTTGGLGMVIVNSDDLFEKKMEEAGLDQGKPEDIFSDEGQALRDRAKQVTTRRQDMWMDGRLGIIVDGTGKDTVKIGRQKRLFDQLGYDTYMIFVNTSLDVAQERNMKRRRKLEPKAVESMWNAVQRNIGAFQSMFGRGNFVIVDNNKDVSDGDIFAAATKEIRKLIKSKPNKPQAKKWIANELKKKARGDTGTVGTGRGGGRRQRVSPDKLKNIKKSGFSKFARRTG